MAKKNQTQPLDNDTELMEALKAINKSYGEGSVMCLGESAQADIEAISSGSIMLDYALGIGGYPKGRIVEIYGPESSGKTTLAIHAVAEAQKKGLKALYVDTENAFDKEYAARLGVDVDKLLFTQPSCGEEALEIADRLIKTGKIGIVVIDSVATLTPKAEIEGEMGDNKVGLQARLMSQALRKMTATIKSTNCLCIFINQLREKIGVMFGNPEITSGGNALKFYATQRLDIRKVTTLKEGEEAVANQVRVKIIKNKVAPPFKKAEFEIEFGKGINTFGEVLDAAIQFGIIQRSGSWFSYEDAKIAQGRENVKTLLKDNPEFYEEVKKKVIDELTYGNQGLFDAEDVLNQ